MEKKNKRRLALLLLIGALLLGGISFAAFRFLPHNPPDDAPAHPIRSQDTPPNTKTSTEPPTLLLKGDAELDWLQGDDFSEPGFKATDAEGKDISDTVQVDGSVDSTTPGEYQLTYRVRDANGNQTVVHRTVRVIARPAEPISTSTSGAAPATPSRASHPGGGSLQSHTPPPSTPTTPPSTPPSPPAPGVTILQLSGYTTLYLEVGEIYHEPGFTVHSNQGVTAANVAVTGSVDSSQIGTYTVTYQLTAQGVTTTKTRTVIVQDTQAPTLALSFDVMNSSNKSERAVIKANEPITIPDWNCHASTCSRHYYANLPSTAITASDASGNTASLPLEITHFEERLALYNLSKAYYHRGPYLQYDQRALDKVNNVIDPAYKTANNITTTLRRELGIAPERAYRDKISYLDCSSFMYNIYRVGTGFRINDLFNGSTTESMMDFATNHPDSPVVAMTHYLSPNDDKTAVLEEMQSTLRNGDMIVYRESGSTATNVKGHVLYYIGGDTFIHATGNSFRYTSIREYEEEAGTVAYVPMKALTEPGYFLEAVEDGDGGSDAGDSGDPTDENEEGGSTTPDYAIPMNDRYLYSGNKISFAILRPLNDPRAQTLTPQTTARSEQYDIDAETYASINPHHTVRSGQSITYTIALTNHRASAHAPVVSASVPAGTSLVSTSDASTISGTAISWQPTIAAGATVSVSYTVTVTATSGAITNNSMQLGDLALGPLQHAISRPLTPAQQQRLHQSISSYSAVLGAANYAGSGTGNNYRIAPEAFGSSTLGTAGFIRAAYWNAFGADMRFTNTNLPFFSLVQNDGANYTNWVQIDANQTGDLQTFRTMQVPHLYGGREVSTFSSSNIVDARSSRTRYLHKDMLMTGDILAYDYGANYQRIIYLYDEDAAGNSRLIRFGPTGITIKTGADEAEVFTNILSKRHFVVLRPSQAFNFAP